MVQSGYNTGPQHVKVFGRAKSYSRKLSDADKETHDTDVLGLASLMWCIVSALMPAELVEQTVADLTDRELPRFATRHVEDGMCQ